MKDCEYKESCLLLLFVWLFIYLFISSVWGIIARSVRLTSAGVVVKVSVLGFHSVYFYVGI